MNAADRHLIATDLDSTILSDLFSLSVKSVWKLMELKDAGHIVMIATARPTCLALPYYRIMGLNTLLSTVNGNYMYHPDDPSIPMIRHELSPEQTELILQAAKDAGITNAYLHSDDLIHLTGPRPDHPYYKIMFDQSNLKEVKELPPVACGRYLAFAPTEVQARAVRDALAQHKDMHCTIRPQTKWGYDIIVTPITADKWISVQEAAQFYGIREENIWCFGDENNDRMMVENAAHGYVMVNGNPQLVSDMRAQGKGVTHLSCDQGGVGDILEKFLK